MQIIQFQFGEQEIQGRWATHSGQLGGFYCSLASGFRVGIAATSLPWTSRSVQRALEPREHFHFVPTLHCSPWCLQTIPACIHMLSKMVTQDLGLKRAVSFEVLTTMKLPSTLSFFMRAAESRLKREERDQGENKTASKQGFVFTFGCEWPPVGLNQINLCCFDSPKAPY